MRSGAAALVAIAGALALISPAVAAAAAPRTGPGPSPLVVDRPRFEPIGDAPLSVKGLGEFRGAIDITRSGGGIAVVNRLPLDDYLRGISEVPVSWPPEAQKAQAIAARTYALYEIGRDVNTAYKAAGADICATQACQVYTGLAKERRPGSSAWSSAVEQTSGQVLVYKGRPIVAKYSSSNGGQTVGGGQPYLRSTKDPDDRYSPLHQWTSSLPLADVVRVAGLPVDTVDVHREGDEMVATTIDPDGNSVQHRLAAVDFRLRINDGLPTPPGLPLAIPSIRFDAGTTDGVVRVDGRGWGHGIGLSQYGALGKALRGLKAPDILAAYYAGLKPVSVPAELLPREVGVAVALEQPQAVIADTGAPFRIVDAAGAVVAHHATGAWSARPAPGGRVSLVPPADQGSAPTAALLGLEPAEPRRAQRVTLRLSLAGPGAVTRLTLVGPDGVADELDPPTLRTAGPLAVDLAPSSTPAVGEYRLDIERDAGGGRVATTSLAVGISDQPAVAPSPAGAAAGPARSSNRGRPELEALAGALVALVGARAWRVGRRRRPELH
jgi:stage II sporulation protein D